MHSVGGRSFSGQAGAAFVDVAQRAAKLLTEGPAQRDMSTNIVRYSAREDWAVHRKVSRGGSRSEDVMSWRIPRSKSGNTSKIPNSDLLHNNVIFHTGDVVFAEVPPQEG